jgi:hypothetical protein
MPNSTAQAALTITILDGLGTTNQPLYNHIVPPVAYSGNPQTSLTQNTCSAYLTISPGSTLNLFNNPPNSPFLFVHNAGSSGVLQLQVTSAASPSGPELFVLTPGGIWLFANSSFSVPNTNYLTNATLSVLGTVPAIAEYVYGV